MTMHSVNLPSQKNPLDRIDLERWKREFYKAYERQNYKEAEEIYLTVGRFYDALPDVHAAYRFHKRMSRLSVIPLALLLIIIAVLLFYII